LTSNPLITAVIPVRLSTGHLYDETQRVERIIRTLPPSYRPIIVDYGTASERAGELRDLASRFEVDLVRAETEDQPFSVGRARDIGTMQAKTPLVIFHDVDFLMSRASYERLVDEARLRGMPENAYAFFAVPGAYLTEAFTDRYVELHGQGEGALGDVLLHDAVMRRDRSVFENHTYAISAIVASRYHLLAIGGHDPSFVGHGAEDFELMHRLSSYALRGPKPVSYFLNTMNNSIQRYEGFRAYYALYGIDVFQRGLQMAHLWHPRREDAGYLAPKTENQQRVGQLMRDYDAGRSWLMPLADVHSPERTLFVVKDPAAPSVRALRHAYPALGTVEYRVETDIADAEALVAFVDREGFTRTLFLNPYGNAHRLALYRGLREAGRRLVVWDRGGLSNSWFFDQSGFLSDGSSYAPERWDRPLDAEERSAVIAWLCAHRAGETLEANGPRAGADGLRRDLGVGGRKVVFAALQRPQDTATVHFAGPCGDAPGFNQWLTGLAAVLDPEKYVVVAKKHPLEAARPEIGGAIFAPDDAHVEDLMDLADVVVVMNSGVGLLGLAAGKPVVCCGEAYYAHPSLAIAVTSPEALALAVLAPRRPDEEKRLAFFHYLVNEFYSFGPARYEEGRKRAEGRTRVVKAIRFDVVRGLTLEPVRLGASPKRIRLSAPIYYSYGGVDAIRLASTPDRTLLADADEALAGADYETAVRNFETLFERQPDDRGYRHALVAATLKRHGSPLAALMELTVPRQAGQADAAYDAGDFERAAELYKLLTYRAPDNARYLRALAESYLQLGAPKLAIATLERAIALAPGHKATHARLADLRLPWWKRLLRKDEPLLVTEASRTKAAGAASDGRK
jgi:predicted glycosyltransferase involved in capsule biosynthesis